MENIDGALAFRATLDIDDFDVSAEAMERRIKRVSSTTMAEADMMDQSVLSFAQNGAKYIATYLIGQGMGNLLQSIVTTRGQFQQLEIAFETMLGSGTKARQLMEQTAQTAATTPFDLLGVAGGIKQLLAYGESATTVNDTLVRLGNIASGLSIPLNDIVYLYGTTMTQGRLFTQDVRQFMGRGIPLVKELSAQLGKTEEEINAMVTASKIGFPEVKKVIEKMTNSGGQFYNLMEKQSKSLTGLISNLGDAWDSQLNRIGESNQEALSTGLTGAIDLVNNLDKVLNIVKAISIAYGSYKAAIVFNTIVTKGYTGIALVDNTVRQAKITLLKLDAKVTGETAKQTEAMTAAQEAQVKSLLKQLSTEQQANLAQKLRASTIDQLLTAQQKEHLSFLNITTASKEYEAEALKIMSIEQKEALSKVDLTAKSEVYRNALKSEVEAKAQNLEVMRSDVKASAEQVKNRTNEVAMSVKATEAARWEVQMAKRSGDATRVAAAEKRLEAAVTNQAISRKAREAAITEFNAKKKSLETLATRQSTLASIADTTAKTTQSTVTSIFTAVTTKATLAVKSLWLAMKTNPLGWILSAVGLVISAFTLFSNKTDEAKTVEGEFQDATRKSSEELRSFMAILQNSESGTSTHRKALEKINAICKEYNKTLLKENATLDDQRAKYDELRAAIQSTTAEKLKAKYIEAAMAEQAEVEAKALEELQNKAKRAIYDTGETQYIASPMGVGVSTPKYEQSGHIRKASNAVWEAVISDARDAAEDLKDLTGSAYDTALEQMLDKTLIKVQQATLATDAEIKSFKAFVSQTYTEVIDKSNETRGVVENTTNSMNRWFSIDQTPTIAESVDYVAMSFGELDKLLIDTQSEISKLNGTTIVLDADKSKLSDLYTTLKMVGSAISIKTDNLNTEAGISERVKQLKEERENVEINSDRYKELSKSITTLEKRLPKNTTNDDATKKAEQAAEKQRQAQVKAEQSRIEVMEEGYEKRRALLDFQHQQELHTIEVERKELEKARKEAGHSGLSSFDQQNFDDRVNSENTSYTKAQNKLFDGEIDYKRSQYELYFRWVRNMGEDVANTQFATLLKGGSSYRDYVEKEIAKLKTKQADGVLTNGESSHLIALNMQYDEITGAKSAMDAFKESVSNAINQAGTLAEKIQAVADAKERLQSGSTGLVGADEQTEANLFINEQESANDKELQQQLISDLDAFEKRKQTIREVYAALRKQLQSKGATTEVIENLNQSEAADLKTVYNDVFEELQQGGSIIAQIFDETAKRTTKQINTLRKQTKDLISYLASTSDKDITAGFGMSAEQLKALKASPEQIEAINKALDDLYEKGVKKNPFAQLATDSKALFSKGGMSVENIGAFSSSLNAVTGQITNVTGSLKEMFEASGNEKGAEIVAGIEQGLSSVTNIASGFAQGGIIGGAMAAVGELVKGFANAAKVEAEHQAKLKEIRESNIAQQEAYNQLLRDQNLLYEEGNNILSKDAYGTATNAIAQAKRDAIALKADIAKLGQVDIETGSYTTGAWFWKKQHTTYTDLLTLYPQLIDANGQLDTAMAQTILDTRGMSDAHRKLLEDALESQEAFEESIGVMSDYLKDTFGDMGVQLSDDLVSAFKNGESAAEAFGNTVNSMLEDMVSDMIYSTIFADMFNKASQQISKIQTGYNEDGTSNEYANMTDSERLAAQMEVLSGLMDGVDDKMDEAEKMLEWAKQMGEDAGLDNFMANNPSLAQDPLQGAVKSMSEETGGLIAGRMNAMVITQSEQLAIMNRALIYQAEIAMNTKNTVIELQTLNAKAKKLDNIESALRDLSKNTLLPLGVD